MHSENYLRNPVIAAFHDYQSPAIGRTIQLDRTDERIMAKVEFLPNGIYPLADIRFEQYKAGFMNAWSIGFIPAMARTWSTASRSTGRRFRTASELGPTGAPVPAVSRKRGKSTARRSASSWHPRGVSISLAQI